LRLVAADSGQVRRAGQAASPERDNTLPKGKAMAIAHEHARDDVQTGIDRVVTVEHFVPHVSTVPANLGQTVGLSVRERFLASATRSASSAPVVLMIHGGYAPSPVAYDLPYRDFSLMESFARAGCRVFAMTHTGYGSSPKPMMDDPCNVAPEFQHLLIPHILKEPQAPRYPFKLVSSQTEFDEIETVANFIRERCAVDRINLYGWSTGAPRAGGFAAQHPDKVDKLILVAPAQFFPSDTPPAQMPEPGSPTILQTWDVLMGRRWQDDVHCPNQVDDPAVRDVLWRELMEADGLGATWEASGRGLMRAPNRMNYGWRINAAKIQAPTLVLLGEFDNYEQRRDSWKGLRVEHKVFIKVRCASHFMQFEYARYVLQNAARQWIENGSVDGVRSGEFESTPEGALVFDRSTEKR
jgi:pimeloyl-ACP methyl ester carboxylesterase